MKTLNIALLALTFVAGAGSAALAADGPHNGQTAQLTYSNSIQQDSVPTLTNAQVDQQSQATLDLNLRGERARLNH